ncbi:MAG TPA: hypothetical protein VFC19_12015 [Candidatus Limnocylindrales bacterium]|nr:hypothetical protein [Candidatus Limnocylindrales bacterium]
MARGSGRDTRDPLTGALSGLLAHPPTWTSSSSVYRPQATDGPVHFEIATV